MRKTKSKKQIVYIERERSSRCEKEIYPEGHKTSWFASSLVEMLITFSFEEHFLRGIEIFFFKRVLLG